jgi:hypothetical protein
MLSSVYDRPRTRSIAMKPTCETRRLICAVLALGALSLTTRANASAGDFYNSDHQARVIAHLPLSGAGATQMFLRKQGRDQYLYVQRPSQQGFTVINVTKPERPKVVRRVPLETRTIMGSGFVVTETPDLSAARKASGAAGNGEGEMVPESIHIVDISDSAPSRTVQTFNGANSSLQDPARNLIYVVDGDGVWILSGRQVSRKHKCSSSDAISSNPGCD